MATNPRVSVLLGLILIVQWSCHTTCLAQEGDDATTVPPVPSAKEFLQSFVSKILDQGSEGATDQILGSGISAVCSLRILKVVNALRNVEPWVVRMIDATGKYPTGLLQGSLMDLGAFDECVETVVTDSSGRERVRAQYCNLFLKPGNASEIPDFIQEALTMSHERAPAAALNQGDERVSGIQLGICVPTECTAEDIVKLIVSFSGGGFGAEVKGCVTNQYPPPDKRQVSVITFLGVLTLIIFTSTIVDMILTRRQGRESQRNNLVKCITAFSVVANTRILLARAEKESDAHSFRFLHGIRFLSMVWIVLGHAYSFGSGVASRLVNVLSYTDSFPFTVVAGGYLNVDSFLFIGGFLVAYNLSKPVARRNIIIVWATAASKFYIRIMAPAFFMIMCIYLLPLIITGPRAQELYEEMFTDVQNNWLYILLNVRNIMRDINVEALGHLWYLSVAFQLLIVSLTVILAFKRKPWMAVVIFSVLSLLSCAIPTWQVYGNGMLPFPMPQSQSYHDFLESLNNLYSQTAIHGVAFFVGCATSILLSVYKDRKLSSVVQMILWLVALLCCNLAVFMMYDWNRGIHPAQWAKACATFFQRLLWSLWLGWLTFACATARGGFICKFLSWEAFVPLSRLTYGVYLIQVPYFFIRNYTSRDRIFYSHFTVLTQFFGALIWSYLLSYLMFIACEAPVGRLEKLVLQRERRTVDKDHHANGKGTDFDKNSAKLSSSYINNGFIERSHL